MSQQNGEGEPESNQENGEDTERLEQCGQDLQKHHHVNPEYVKPTRNDEMISFIGRLSTVGSLNTRDVKLYRAS